MEFSSYGLTAKITPNDQVLLINHADDLQKFLFSYFILGIYTDFGFQHIDLFSYVSSKGPTHEDILSIYALYIKCAYISMCAYAIVIKNQYQQ